MGISEIVNSLIVLIFIDLTYGFIAYLMTKGYIGEKMTISKIYTKLARIRLQ